MARGKSLDESDLRVVKTDIEEGHTPYFLIDRKYGLACDDLNEILVEKRIAKRTNKDNPDDPYIEEYIRWEDCGYYRNMVNALKGYLELVEKDKKKVLKATNDINVLISLQKEVHKTLENSIDIFKQNTDFIGFFDVLDERKKLANELSEVRQLKNKLKEEYESLMNLIAEKRRIIVKK